MGPQPGAPSAGVPPPEGREVKTFVVTGATGFIGGHLARKLLERGDRVVALCRDGDPPAGCETVRGDLEDLRACERAIVEHQPDGVFHLAAQALVGNARRDPHATLESNVRGTYNLLEAFRRHRANGTRMVMASSDKAYGELSVDYEAYDEGFPLEGRGPYDVSKSCADLIAQSYGVTYSLPVAIIRAGNVYGPGDSDPSRIVPGLIRNVLDREPLTIHSDGSPVREYLHVDDVVRGYFSAFEYQPSNRSRAYNLGTKKPLTVVQLAQAFLDMLIRVSKNKYSYTGTPTNCAYDVESYLQKLSTLGEPSIRILGTRKGEIQRQVLDPTRAEDELKWKAHRDLDYGLEETLVAGWRNR